MKSPIATALTALFLIAACSQPAATSAAAETSSPSLQADLTREGACYARDYDAAHLAAHPQQTVTHFFLGAAGAEWRATETPPHFAVAFGFRLKDRADLYAGVGICAPEGESLACDVEGDGGSFSVTRSSNGLRVAVQRLEVEGAHDFSPDLAAADNRIMLLSTAEARACAME